MSDAPSELTLADVPPGQRATVVGFADHGPMAARLLALGIIDGTEVDVVRRAPTGDPIEIRFSNSAIALRRDEARLVRVSPLAS